MIRHRWEHHEVSGWGGFDCSCSRASFQENHQYHAHRRRALFLEAKVAVGKNKATKATKTIDNWKGSVQRKVLVERGPRFRCAIRCVHRKGAPDGKPTPNAETWESRSALATRHQRQPCRLFPRPPPSGAQDDRWFVGDPLGLTPPGYELAPHTGLDKAPPRTRDEGRLDARATSHWSRIATQPRSCLPGAVTSA